MHLCYAWRFSALHRQKNKNRQTDNPHVNQPANCHEHQQSTLYLSFQRPKEKISCCHLNDLQFTDVWRNLFVKHVRLDKKKNKGNDSKGLWQAVHRAKHFTWRCSVMSMCKLSCPLKHSGSRRSSKTNSGGKCRKLSRSVKTLTTGAELRSCRFECAAVFAWWELTLQPDQWGTLLLSQGASWKQVGPHHAPCCVQRWEENNIFVSATKCLLLWPSLNWPSIVWTIYLGFSAYKKRTNCPMRSSLNLWLQDSKTTLH